VHRRAYGREPIYLWARANGRLVGALPVVVFGGALRRLAASIKPGVRAAGGGQRLSSVIRGGPVGSDVEARGELLASACSLVDEQGSGDLTRPTCPGVRSSCAGCARSSLANFKRQWGAAPVDSFRYTYAPGARAASARVSEAAEQQPSTPDESGARNAAWDRIPVDPLGVAATVGHRLL
jgi:hypothetical protein